MLILSPEALSGYWEESKYMPEGGKEASTRGQRAFQLAANIIAYATGKEPPKQRLSTRKIIEVKGTDKAPPNGFVQPLQIKLDESPPADAAMRNLMGYLRDNAKLDVALSKVSLPPNDEALFQFKLLYMHGKKAFEIDEAGIKNIQANLQSGGILLADACCGDTAPG